MTTRRLLTTYGVIALAISLPFTIIHLIARPDDAPITPLQHVTAAAANFFGPWGVVIVRLVDFPNAGLRSFGWTIAIGLTLVGGVGGSVALADRFIQPNDGVREKKVLATLPIAAGGELPGGAKLKPGHWQTLNLHWDIGKGECDITVDGKPACTLPMSKETTAGPSYVRFRSTAETIDSAGMLVESVEAAVR